VLLKENALEAGENTIKFQMEVSKPVLWWPRGYGDQVLIWLLKKRSFMHKTHLTFLLLQPLYELSITARGASEERRMSVHLGLRQVKLITQPDDVGESFYLELNG